RREPLLIVQQLPRCSKAPFFLIADPAPAQVEGEAEKHETHAESHCAGQVHRHQHQQPPPERSQQRHGLTRRAWAGSGGPCPMGFQAKPRWRNLHLAPLWQSPLRKSR
ncbi:unnamed protein product, partial [Gulo gulo]